MKQILLIVLVFVIAELGQVLNKNTTLQSCHWPGQFPVELWLGNCVVPKFDEVFPKTEIVFGDCIGTKTIKVNEKRIFIMDYG